MLKSVQSRWMRLLFGREFPFDDVLLMWDLLFAHGLRSDLVDFTCISMLLRIRWQCWLTLSPSFNQV
jgi:TBC1 domain family protein 5